MTLNQILVYLDVNLNPHKGGKIQLSKVDNKETIKAFVFDREINSYAYIFNFEKEVDKDGKDVFKSSVRSGYSGLDYALGIPMDAEIYENLKKACLAGDGAYMNEIKEAIEAIQLDYEEPEPEVKPEDGVE